MIDKTDEQAVDEELARLNVLLKMFKVGSVRHYRDGPGYVLETWMINQDGYGVFADCWIIDDLEELADEARRLTTEASLRDHLR